jgi:predicted XRE-type DNA-binding protein
MGAAMSDAEGPNLAPSVALRLLSFELSGLVEQRSVRHAELAERLSVTREAVSIALAGRSLFSRAALEVVLDHLDASERLPRLRHLLCLARPAARRPDPGDRDLVVGLEAYAERIEVYDATTVAELMRDERRRSVLSAAEPPEVVWVLEEHVARRGFSAVDYEWFRQVMDLATVLVIPSHVGTPPGLVGGFEIVYGPVGAVVCERTHSRHHYSEAVAEYRSLFSRVRELALTREVSRELLLTHNFSPCGDGYGGRPVSAVGQGVNVGVL